MHVVRKRATHPRNPPAEKSSRAFPAKIKCRGFDFPSIFPSCARAGLGARADLENAHVYGLFLPPLAFELESLDRVPPHAQFCF